MKTKIILLTAVCLVILGFFVFYFWEGAPKEENKIKVGYDVTSIIDGPIIIAKETGIFERYNLKPELISLSSGKEMQQAISSGQLDIASAGVTNFLIPISKGAPVKILTTAAASPTLLFVDPEKNIKTFSDLIGKKVASRIGSISNYGLGVALIKESIPYGAINIVEVESGLRPIALMEKKIVDAAVAGQDDLKTYTNAGAAVMDEWGAKGYSKNVFPRTNIAVNTNFMDKNKENIGRFLDAFIDAQKFIKENPDQAAKIISAHIKKGTGGINDFSPEDVKEQWEETKYFIWSNPEDLVEISKVAKEMGEIQEALLLNQIFDSTFEQKLKDAQKTVYPDN